ncbi:MAG: hypothetical protein JSW73_03360 [Candidatus Woesearchaeota archaeon]|nr:MAG: hypothetical protein JSW73_03360 [Candidatus Woesearchaeota archaeon]
MTYLIEGTVIREEKPDKYINNYVSKTVKKFGPTTEIDTIITNSEKFTHRSDRKFEYIDTLKKAVKLCEKKEVDVSKSKLFVPSRGWESYLDMLFRETKEYKTLSGELELWKEFRVPSPWLYFYARGKLENSFAYDSESKSFVNTPLKGKTKKTSYGIMSPIRSWERTNVIVRVEQGYRINY